MWDLGWVSRGSDWENHPWGPLVRGYRVPAERYLLLRRRLRTLRLSLFLLCLAFFGLALHWNSYVPILVLLLLGSALELWVTREIFRNCERTAAPMGWKAGLWYLSLFCLPHIMRASRWVNMLLMGLALYLIWEMPRDANSYLLLAIFVGIQFLLYYLQEFFKPSA